MRRSGIGEQRPAPRASAGGSGGDVAHDARRLARRDLLRLGDPRPGHGRLDVGRRHDLLGRHDLYPGARGGPRCQPHASRADVYGREYRGGRSSVRSRAAGWTHGARRRRPRGDDHLLRRPLLRPRAATAGLPVRTHRSSLLAGGGCCAVPGRRRDVDLSIMEVLATSMDRGGPNLASLAYTGELVRRGTSARGATAMPAGVAALRPRVRAEGRRPRVPLAARALEAGSDGGRPVRGLARERVERHRRRLRRPASARARVLHDARSPTGRGAGVPRPAVPHARNPRRAPVAPRSWASTPRGSSASVSATAGRRS